jgi:phosphoglycerate dehydrogenase-like enzyme
VERVEALEQLLSIADLVSIHTPLTDETRHLIGERELRLLDGKYLVNTARGAIVDGGALCRALLDNRLKGVALDVYEDETAPIPPVMRARHDVLLSPHVAFYSESALPELRAKAAHVLFDLLKHGSHRNVV